MNVQSALRSQYHAALKTLRDAIEKCPDALWDAKDDRTAAFWRVAYHALFFTHFYLQKSVNSFSPWKKHRKGVENLDEGVRGTDDTAACKAYTRDEVLEYWHLCDCAVDENVDAMDLTASESGFPWYPMPKLEHQIVNIRHIQHHAAILSQHLRKAVGAEVG